MATAQDTPDTLPANFNNWDKSPDTLPADFKGWDQPTVPQIKAEAEINRVTRPALGALPTFNPAFKLNAGLTQPLGTPVTTPTQRAQNVLNQAGMNIQLTPPKPPVPYELSNQAAAPTPGVQNIAGGRSVYPGRGAQAFFARQAAGLPLSSQEMAEVENPSMWTLQPATEEWEKMKAGGRDIGTAWELAKYGEVKPAVERATAGAFKEMDPLIAYGLYRNPYATVVGLAGAQLGGEAFGAGARAMHFAGEDEEFAQNIGALAGGIGAATGEAYADWHANILRGVTNDYLARGVPAEQAAQFAKADVGKFIATGNGDYIGMPGAKVHPLADVSRRLGAGALAGVRAAIPLTGERPEERLGLDTGRIGPLGQAGYTPEGPPTLPVPDNAAARPGIIRSVLNAYAPRFFATPEQIATEAFRPRNSKWNWREEIASALPDMKRGAQSLGLDLDNVTLEQSLRSATAAQQAVWAQYENQYLGPNQDFPQATDPVAQAMRSLITDRMREQNPGLAAKIERLASTYDNRQLTVRQLQDRVSQLNDETRAIEARYVVDKAAAKRSPQQAYKFAERDTLRDLLDKAMDEGGPQAAALRRRYGSLTSVRDVISRRIPVADRASKMPLSKLMAYTAAAGQIALGIATLHPMVAATGFATLATEHYLRSISNPDYLTSLAYRKTQATPPWRPMPEQGNLPFPPIDLFGIQQTPAPQRTGPFAMPASTANIPEQRALPPGPEAPAALPPQPPPQPAAAPTPPPEAQLRFPGPAEWAQWGFEPEAAPSAGWRPPWELARQGRTPVPRPEPPSQITGTQGEAVSPPTLDVDPNELKAQPLPGRRESLLDRRGITGADRIQVLRDQVNSLRLQIERERAAGEPAVYNTVSQLQAAEAQLADLSEAAGIEPPELGQGPGTALQSGALPPKMAEPLPGFYYKSEQVAREKLPNRASGDAMLATLRNNGVKEAEIADLGLDRFKGAPTVSKDEILNHIQSNALDVNEIWHGDTASGLRHQYNIAYDENVRLGNDLRRRLNLDEWLIGSPEEKQAILSQVSEETRADLQRLDDTQREVERLRIQIAQQPALGRPRHGTWTLPGGQNYREALIQMRNPPAKQKPQVLPGRTEAGHYEFAPGEAHLQPTAGTDDSWDVVGPNGNLIMGNLPAHIAEHVLEMNGGRVRRPFREEPANAPPPGFAHLHWTERNILAHYRLTDHVAADGKKTLVVEELQSDPHQRLRDLQDKIDQGQFLNKSEREDYDMFKQLPLHKNWSEVLSKRVLRYAAENGYDRIAWTTGTQQAERYRDALLQQIDKVQWKKNSDDTYGYTGFKNNRQVINQDKLSPDQLEAHLGKDIADQIVKGAGTQPAGVREGTIPGVDLQVGGEGMKAFYDRIVPNFLRKYIKPQGGQVGSTQIMGGNKLPYEVVNDRGEFWDAFRTREQADAAVADANRRDPNPIRQAQGLTGGGYFVRERGMPVHSIDITPEMRQQYLTKGQPLYSEPLEANLGNIVQQQRARRVTQFARDMQTSLDTGGPNRAAFVRIDDNARAFLRELNAGSSTWQGINWDVSQAQGYVRALRDYANKLQRAGADREAANVGRLADQMDRAIDLNYDPNAGHGGVPVVHNPLTETHEAVVHAGQRAFAKDAALNGFTDVARTAAHPAVQKAMPVLDQLGISTDAHRIAEMEAHIRDGNYRALGLTREDALSFMRHSRDVLAQHHGAEVMANPPRLAKGYVDAIDEFIRREGGYGQPEATAGPAAAAEAPYEGAAARNQGVYGEAGTDVAGGVGRGAGAPDPTGGVALEARRLPSREQEEEAPRGAIFASPNVSELPSAAAAKTRIGGAAHQSFRNMIDQLHEGLGLGATSENSTGIWQDGAENSVMSHHENASADQLRYAAALQGKWGNQKSALSFAYDPQNGPDTHFSFTVEKGTMQDSPEIISERLRNAGVPFSNITKVPGGWRVDVVDIGNELHDRVVEAANRFKADTLNRAAGKGEYIGADPTITDDAGSRASAQENYAQIIREAESRNPQWGEVRNSIEAGGDYNRLRRALALAQEKGPLIPAEHLSPEGDLTRASQFSTQLTGDQPRGQYKYSAALNREDYYDIREDPENFFSQAKNQNDLERLVKQAGYKGVYDPTKNQVTDFKGAAVSPEFIPQRIKDLFDPQALSILNTPGRQRKFLDTLSQMESRGKVKEWIAAAQQGISGQKWYQRSGEAFDALTEVAPEIFRPEDKQRFVDLVAALSPQQPVVENIRMALESWAKWMRGNPAQGIAPRSTAINDLRRTIDLGTVDIEGRLDNAHRALTGERLSGQKVSDFGPAIRGELWRSVSDRIMGLFAGKNTRETPLTKEDYLAISAMAKMAAREAGIEPSEAQAGIWVWTEMLLDLTGLADRPELKAAPEDVALTPTEEVAKVEATRDFMDLMQQSPKIRALLEQNGVNLDKLDQSLAARAVRQPKPTGEGAADPELLKAAARRVARTALGKPIPQRWRGSTEFPIAP